MKTVQLDDDDHALLKKLAEIEGRSMPKQIKIMTEREWGKSRSPYETEVFLRANGLENSSIAPSLRQAAPNELKGTDYDPAGPLKSFDSPTFTKEYRDEASRKLFEKLEQDKE